MKTLYKYIVWSFVFLLFFPSCAEEIIPSNETNSTEENRNVDLMLSYQSEKSVKIVSRATAEEEEALDDLQIFVFTADNDDDDTNNVLKGYKYITSDLVQDGTPGSFTIKTTTGTSYIYGIANASTAVYQVEDIAGTDWTEDGAQNGEYDLTLAEFKEKMFNRLYQTGGQDIVQEINPSDGRFVMSGVMNDGNPVTISTNEDGTVATLGPNDGNIIKLKRVVSKITMKFSNGNTGNKPVFNLLQYDICNIPTQGRIIEGSGVTVSDVYSTMAQIMPSALSPNTIEVYLPENLQTSNLKESVSWQKDREENTYNGSSKSFDNAPPYGTYVVAKGKYTDNTGKLADVEYTIHLGDIAADVNNYDNERNCEYTYSIMVNGVDDIIVEAKKQDEEDKSDYNQGVEGLVLDAENGKSFVVDSHYESCVMSFSQSDIKTLASSTLGGYVFQVETFGEKSDIFVVNKDWNEKQLAGVDYQWVTFAKGGTYNQDNAKGGTPMSYTATKGAVTGTNGLFTVPELLKYLLDNADNNEAWTNGTMTFTCFIDENYYANMSWGDFVNQSPRKLYIANDIDESSDKHSIYAQVAYAVEQHSIQTFYDRSNSGIVAYGCETIDETYTGSNYSGTSTTTGAVGTFDGRADMVANLAGRSGSDNWSAYTTANRNAIQACMSRNRDLNRDGTVTLDEVRWYVPSYAQYNGLWIGEQALQTESRLYNKEALPSSNNIMHYYANTAGRYTVWAEEGSSFGTTWQSNIKYIKCVRNLKSNNANVEAAGTVLAKANVDEDTEATKFYRYDSRVFDLNGLVDATALRSYTQTGELGQHHEREALNNIRTKFMVANSNLSVSDITLAKVLSRTVKCEGNYGEGTYTSGWRIPNQRELSLMVLENTNGYRLEPTQGNFSSDRGFYSATGFSNSNHKVGFGYGHNAGSSVELRMYDPNLINTEGWVRCVRDME